MSETFVHSESMMGTVVTIQVVGHGQNERQRSERKESVAQALAWFGQIERICTRFDSGSELMQLCALPNQPVPVSAILFEAVNFAVAVARESGGAFDPVIGHNMNALGFNVEYRSGRVVETGIAADDGASYRDVHLDAAARTITLARPVVLDLGAVAKGLAVDMAARELAEFRDFAIDAGGDLWLAGHNGEGAPWAVGIRHPRDKNLLIETVHVSDCAVCTSGDYERSVEGNPAKHHILDARTRETATSLASVTVIGPTAMVADAFGTAAFALGPEQGSELLERHGLEGILVTPSLEVITTKAAAR